MLPTNILSTMDFPIPFTILNRTTVFYIKIHTSAETEVHLSIGAFETGIGPLIITYQNDLKIVTGRIATPSAETNRLKFLIFAYYAGRNIHEIKNAQ